MTCPACKAENDSSAADCTACGASLLAPTAVVVSIDLSPGALFHGRYEILGFLGRGGMGMVYRARDKTLDEIVAIKVLRPDFAQDPSMAERFRSEIKMARRVRHRNVCAIHDYGEERGLLYISMELVEGVDLKHVLKAQGRLPFDEAFDVAIQVAEGLQAVHEAGIIHRDLKTPNIMVDPQKVARLMDFGIAKRQEGGGASTATGQVLGTPEYMSPEQAQGQRVDFRSDVYALGVVIYEVFTGDVPFRGDTPISTILKHLHDPPPIDQAGVPDALRPILRRALAKDPEARYSSARALADALRGARAASRRQQETPTAVLEGPTLKHPGMSAPRGSRARAGVAVLAGLIGLGLAARLLLTGSATPPTPATPLPTPARPSPTTPPTPSATPLATPTPVAERTRASAPATTPRPTPPPRVAAIPSPVPGPIAIPATPAPTPVVAATPPPALARSAEPGQLQIAVRPWAEVVLDGRVLGTTPLDKLSLESGTHVVLLRHPAYEELRRSIVVTPGETTRLIVDLAKEGASKR